MGASMARHQYTADNTEMLQVTVYRNWGDIKSAAERSEELVKAAWPDEKARKAYFKKADSYYTTIHSDEIYYTMPNAKIGASSTEPRLLYMQKRHFAFPEEGSVEEFQALNKEYTEAVIHKNSHVIGYYPMRHAWGADKRDFIEVFVVNSMADLEASNDARGDLVKSHWTDEAARKAFFKKSGKYFTGFHADYIYETIPELSK